MTGDALEEMKAELQEELDEADWREWLELLAADLAPVAAVAVMAYALGRLHGAQAALDRLPGGVLTDASTAAFNIAASQPPAALAVLGLAVTVALAHAAVEWTGV